MSYQATVVNIMIASPSDVSPARQVARRVIDEWNVIHQKDKKIVLTPIGWESHSFPEAGDRPQAIINGQLLEDADLLVAIFWTRIGSPTGAAQSGTVEEIEEHLHAGKPAMIYFSSEPVRPDSVDNDQYVAVKAFKQSLRERCLYDEYEDLGAFKTTFTRQLAQIVQSRFANTAPGSTSESSLPAPDAVTLDGTTVTYSGSTSRGLPPKPGPAPLLGAMEGELLGEASQDPQAQSSAWRPWKVQASRQTEETSSNGVTRVRKRVGKKLLVVSLR